MTQQLASIHPNAQIGKDVIIDPFVTVKDNVVIGDGTHLSSGAIILEGSRIGKNCEISSYAIIGGVPQDLKYKGEETTVEIGDNTSIREFVTINRGTASRGKTVIGKNCLIMAYNHIAHDCILGDNIIIANATQIAGEVEIGDSAIISGGCLVHQFCKIGAHVMIQGGSKVVKDVPPYIVAGREPLGFSGLNLVGLKRRGFSRERIEEIQEIYRCIYMSGLNNSDALQKIEEEVSFSVERDVIINFVRNSSRGIVRSVTNNSK